MAVNTPDEDFQQELLELFSAEAEEWLRQGTRAIHELRQQSNSQESMKLLDTIQTGMTNLGGSAATVNLPDVEQAAFSVLPVIESLRSLGGLVSNDQCQALLVRLWEIAELVNVLGFSTIIIEETQAPADPASTPSFINRLMELRDQTAETSLEQRGTVEFFIDRLTQESRDGGAVTEVSATKFLRELEGRDEELLEFVESNMPRVFQAFKQLKEEAAKDSVNYQALEDVLQKVTDMHRMAQDNRAIDLVNFFEGLYTFLHVMLQKGMTLTSKRVPAVESRLSSVIPLTQQWVEIGRRERNAITKVLSA